MTTLFLQDGIVRLDSGIEGQPSVVPTANPVNFHQAISEPEYAPAAEIHAQTFLPPGVNRPPLVIVVPGSLGVAPSHVQKAELLTRAGIATSIIDPFGARGVSSTVSNQAQYSFAASAWDVLATARHLTERHDVDPARIGAQGHSRGGSAVLSAAVLAARPEFAGELRAVYAAYPWCGQQFLNPDIGATRARAIIGDRDEWCLPQQVQGYLQAMRLAGGDASWRIVAGAHHSFDRDTPVAMVADASVAPGAPTIYLDDTGASIHPATGQADPHATERDLMLYGIKAGYGRRGARIGTSGDFANTFHDDMMTFWETSLA